MRVLVSVDMEGIAGVVHSDEIRPGHPEYERGRALLTAEANAAVRGVYAFDANANHGAAPVLVSGDDTVAAEAAEVAPGAHCVRVKNALGARAATTLHPDEACDRIERAVPPALAGRSAVRPLRFEGPVQLDVRAHRPHMIEHALLIPGIDRIDGCTLRYDAPDLPTAYDVTGRAVALF